MDNKVLIIDDTADICVLLQKYLEKNGFDANFLISGKEALEEIKNNRYDIILCDYRLPDYNGLDILKYTKKVYPETVFIIITGYSDVNIAVQAIKEGAYDYIAKPLIHDEILSTVRKGLESNQTLSQTPKAQSNVSGKDEFVFGNSEFAKSILKLINTVAPTDMSVLIQGESGTGKEYVANAIHNRSERRSGPFVALDCGALPKELAGSELFGHVKGAFTGALKDKVGCFQLAKGGTLFLDEIGNLSYENQMKLLRVIQERKVKKIGDNDYNPIDVRIITATNDNLKRNIKSGKFREDLYFRINELGIDLLPIRKRPEDIAMFALHFLRLAAEELNKKVEEFTEEAMDIIKRYSWPGNLREMRNVIKRAALFSTGSSISVKELPEEILYNQDVGPISEQKERREDNAVNLKHAAEIAEKRMILKVLQQTKNNKSKAAEILEVDRKTLYNKMNAYNIEE